MSIFARITSLVFSAFAASAALSLGAEPDAKDESTVESLANITPLVSSSGDATALNLSAAEGALLSGLPSLAIELAKTSLDDQALSAADRNRLLLTLSGSQIATGDFESAAQTLETIPEGSAQKKLQEALVGIYRGDVTAVEAILEAIDPKDLHTEERSWFFVAHAIANTFLGNTEAAEDYFVQAKASTARAMERENIDFARRWASLMGGEKPSEEKLEELEAAYEAAKETEEAARACKLYVVALAKSGDAAKARSVLGEFRSVPKKDKADFALLEGLLAEDAGSEIARNAFQAVISARPSRTIQSTALSGLRRNVAILLQREKKEEAILAAANIEDFLENLKTDGRVKDLELFTRARIAYDVENYRLAEELADELNSRFPASPFVQDSLRLQIGVALMRKEFRRAVSLLERLNKTDLPPDEQLRTAILIADCNFLSGDYALAANAYSKVSKNDAIKGEGLGVIFFQEVLSEIRSGKVLNAEALLDSELAKRVPPEWTMRAECVVIEALKNAGLSNSAAMRAEKFLERTDLFIDFRIRILWIRTLLALELNDPKKALENAQKIEDLIANFGDDTSEALKSRAPELLSRLGLLKARALFLSGDQDAGLKELADLRERYPDSAASVISWLEEGRHFAEVGRPERAIVCYETLISRYGKQEKFAEYIAIAMFESAQASATVGRPEEALKQMQNLVSTYPKSPLAFYARMHQADFCRILNDFDSALSIYNSLRTSSPDRPEIRMVELRRADVLLAISARSEADETARASFLDSQREAEAAYERLFSLPDQPLELKAEAGFKWAYSVAHSVPAGAEPEDKVNAEKKARTLYWKVVTETLATAQERSGSPVLDGSTGYWLSRSLFALAKSYEGAGDYAAARNIYEKICGWADEGLIPGKRYAETLRRKILEK